MPKINIRLWKRQPRFIMKIKVLNNPDGHLYMWTDRTERNIFGNLKNEWWRSWIVISDGLGTSWLTRHSGRYMYRPMQTGNHKDGNAEFSKVHHRECSHCEIKWCYWTFFFCNFIGCFYDYPLDTHLGMFPIFEKCERNNIMPHYATHISLHTKVSFIPWKTRPTPEHVHYYKRGTYDDSRNHWICLSACWYDHSVLADWRNWEIWPAKSVSHFVTW